MQFNSLEDGTTLECVVYYGMCTSIKTVSNILCISLGSPVVSSFSGLVDVHHFLEHSLQTLTGAGK